MAQIIPGFIVGLREGLEAFLIVTLILEYLNKLGKKELHASVTRGMFTGLGISIIFGALLWLLALTIASGSDAVGKLWEAGASFVAVLFITYFIYWMIQHGKTLVQDVRDSVDANLSSKGLFLLATVAVAREGAEIALFAFTAEDKVIYLTGTFSGVVLAAVLALLIYKSLVRVDIGLIFRITLVYLIPQRNEGSGTITIGPLPSECRERKARYPAPWGGSGGEASRVQGLPWGCDTIHSSGRISVWLCYP